MKRITGKNVCAIVLTMLVAGSAVVALVATRNPAGASGPASDVPTDLSVNARAVIDCETRAVNNGVAPTAADWVVTTEEKAFAAINYRAQLKAKDAARQVYVVAVNGDFTRADDDVVSHYRSVVVVMEVGETIPVVTAYLTNPFDANTLGAVHHEALQ